MKKFIMLFTAIVLIVIMSACAKENPAENTQSTTTAPITESTTQRPIESTTAQPKSDSQKGERLKSAVAAQLENADLSGDFKYGKFIYKNIRDAELMYAYEYTEEHEKAAKENAEKLVKQIGTFYSDEIKLHDYSANQIGSGENGIDSVRYEFYYINTQNQLLTIYADSDGAICYVDCAFTW